MLLQISAAGVCKKAQMETSQTRDCAWKTVIDNKHKHTIIATLSVKKGSKFTDPDAQFPRGGALACARGWLNICIRAIKKYGMKDHDSLWPLVCL